MDAERTTRCYVTPHVRRLLPAQRFRCPFRALVTRESATWLCVAARHPIVSASSEDALSFQLHRVCRSSSCRSFHFLPTPTCRIPRFSIIIITTDWPTTATSHGIRYRWYSDWREYDRLASPCVPASHSGRHSLFGAANTIILYATKNPSPEEIKRHYVGTGSLTQTKMEEFLKNDANFVNPTPGFFTAGKEVIT